MAISLGQAGTADSVDAEYFNWESGDRRFMVHMHLDAIDGLARDAIENSEGLPVEVGGILLGQVGRGDRPVVWIERYQRVQINHRSGPDFVLDRDDHAAFEQAARSLSENGELTVVGYYRTHLRAGLQLEDPDRELIGRYFRDTEDLVLLLKPERTSGIGAQFFGRDATGGDVQALGPAFPLRGRVVGFAAGKPEADDPDERTCKTVLPPPPLPEPRNAVGHRRLVPDFQPAGETPKPAREFFMEARPSPGLPPEELEAGGPLHYLRKRWPVLAALLLVGTAVGVMVQQAGTHAGPAAPAQANARAAVRPLGLYADVSGQNWQLRWDPSATVLQGARSVRLFVRDGDEAGVELTPQDLQSGTYRYQAKGRDVTFRMEVTDSGGQLSAESFRTIEPEPAAQIPAAPSERPAPPLKPAVIPTPANFTPPSPSYRVAPVVPASLRPRITATIPLDVRVKIDAHGRVTSAVPVTKPHTGVESFLASRAVYAAKQWRFRPAHQDGKAVSGTEIIHFVFSK